MRYRLAGSYADAASQEMPLLLRAHRTDQAFIDTGEIIALERLRVLKSFMHPNGFK